MHAHAMRCDVVALPVAMVTADVCTTEYHRYAMNSKDAAAVHVNKK